MTNPLPSPAGPSAMHLSTLRLHQLRLGELTGSAEADARAHVHACPTCADRLRHQESARAAFVLTPVPEALVAPAPTSPFDRLRAWWDGLGERRAWGLAAVPVALAAMLSVQGIGPTPTGTNDVGSEGTGADEGIRLKGDAQGLQAWVQSGTSARPLYSNEPLRAGSRLQLRYNPGRHRFVTLAGRDGSGRVEVYGTVPATGPGPQTAPFSLTLDDTLGDQHFYAILTDQRPAADTLARSLAAEPVSVPGAEVESLVVPKE